MAVPNRPAAGAPIESAWGSVAHDTAVAQDIQGGTVVMTFPNSAVGNTTGVTFPRPFAAPPAVVATMGGATGSGVNHNVGVSNITTTGCVLQGREVREVASSGSISVQWLAVGPRA